MKKSLKRLLILSLVTIFSLGFFVSNNTFADENNNFGTSIRLMPVNKIFQISSNSTYDDSFEIFNDGSSEIRVEVYTAPYSYVHSEKDDAYKLGFNNENNFTQLTRWISFLDSSGNYVEKPVFTIEPNNSITVNFRVSTPNNIPAGGQYAVIFVHSLTSVTSGNGIRTEASPGIVVYGRSSEGKTEISAEISNLKIEQSVTEGANIRNNFYATAKIKNTGNVDFTATGKLKIEPIIGGSSYETPDTAGRLSIIPEAELVLSDEWTNTPSIGVYKATWTVTAGGSEDSITRTIFLIPVWFVILSIILLTILIIWIIIAIRKGKKRRSRLAI